MSEHEQDTMEMQCPICKSKTTLQRFGGGFHYSKWPCLSCGGWFDFDPAHEVKNIESPKLVETPGEVRGDTKKFDHGKTMWDILPFDQIEKIVEVMTHGATKYGAESWKTVENAIPRYEAAFMRHYVAWKKGEAVDRDSGLTHLSHAACNLVFLMWLEEQRLGNIRNGRPENERDT